MLPKPLFENQELWKQIHEGYQFRTVQELGATRINQTALVIQEQPPELKELSGVIQEFWNEYKRIHPGAWNSPKWGATDISDLSVNGSRLNVRVLEVDYATIVFAGPRRGTSYEKYLNDQQRSFLSKLKVLGVNSYTREREMGFLTGTKAGSGITQRLYELVPLGMIEHNSQNQENPHLQTLTNELAEETGLDLAKDVEEVSLTHFTQNNFYGELDAIYAVTLKPGSHTKMQNSPEHTSLQFIPKNYLEKIPWNHINPCSAAILKQIGVPLSL